MNVYRLISTLVIIATLALAGCGGGGGGSSPMAGMPPAQQPPAQQPPAQQPPAQQPGSGATPSVSVFGDLNPSQMVADNIVTAIGQAAEATPRAGSVTQSSNVDSNSVTLDRVEVTAEYGASQHRFSVRNGTAWSIGMGEGNPRRIPNTTPPFKGSELSKRVSGGTVYVDAYSDIEAPVTVGGSTDGNVGSVLSAGQSVSYEGGGNSFTFMVRQDGFGCIGSSICAGQSLNANNFRARRNSDGNWEILALPAGAMPVGGGTTPDTDYLSGGIWLFVPDNATSADDYVFGAFADGSDPFEQVNIMPLTGTATYEGAAAGVYSEKTTTTTDIGYFDADVELTANFGGGSDLGTISGSITNIEVDDEPHAATLNLGTANIGSQNSGFFRGAVTGSDNTRSYTGNWGGQFFGNGESDGRPGSVARTFGGSSTDDAVNFVGAFGAHKQ